MRTTRILCFIHLTTALFEIQSRIIRVHLQKLNQQVMTRILISLLVCLCFAACIADDAPSGEVHVQVGDPLPAFSVTLSDGSTFSTTATDGTVRLIMFFDTSCPDCRATLPRVQQLYDNLRGESVSMAFISREEDDASVAAYWEQEGLTLPYHADPTRSLYGLFADASIPRIYIADAEGTVCYMHDDNPIPTLNELTAEVTALLEDIRSSSAQRHVRATH